MLLLFFSFIIFFIICYGYGSIIHPFFSRNCTIISLTLFSGVLFLMTLHTVVSFIFPLNIYYEIIVNGIGIILGIFKTYKNFEKIKFYFSYEFLLLILLILFTASFFPYIVDHFGYYIPTIKWLNEYGIVKGIANLSFILAQQSPWHILQAGIDDTIDPYFKLNSYFLLFYIMYYLEQNKVALLLPLPILLLYVQSPSADLAVIIFTLLLINETCNAKYSLSYLLLISVATCFIKPLAFGLVLWIIYLIYKENKFYKLNTKYWNLSILFSLYIGVLYLIKNFYTSGLLLYPLDFKVANPKWLVSNYVIEYSNKIALLKSYDMKFSIEEISSMSNFTKFINWLKLSGFKGIIHKLFIVIFIIYFSIMLYFRQKKLLVYGFISLLNCVIIYLFSAQYRFMLPILLGLLFIIFCSLKINKMILKTGIYGVSIVMILLISFPFFLQLIVPSFQLSHLMRPYEINLLLMPENYSTPKYKTYVSGNMKINVPIEYPYTYSIPLPAISTFEEKAIKNKLLNPQLINSNTISDGFYSQK